MMYINTNILLHKDHKIGKICTPRNLFVLDFVRNFLSIVPKFFEAYAVRTLMKSGCGWRKISHKSKCKKDSENKERILT